MAQTQKALKKEYPEPPPLDGARGFRLPWYVIVLLFLFAFLGGGAIWNQWMDNQSIYKYPPPGLMISGQPDEEDSPPPGGQTDREEAAIHALVRGGSAAEGQPAVLMLGGWDSVSPVLDFQPLYNTLVDRARVIVVEKPGHGWSSRLFSERTLDNMVGDIMYALDGLREEGPYVIVAEGSAGLEAIRMAELYPFMVSGIVFINAPPPAAYAYRMDRALDYIRSFTYPAPRVTGVFRGIAAFKPELFSENRPDINAEAYAVMYCHSVMSPAMRVEAHMLAQNARDCLRGAADLDVPVVTFVDEAFYQANAELNRVWTAFHDSKNAEVHAIALEKGELPQHAAIPDISRAILELIRRAEGG